MATFPLSHFVPDSILSKAERGRIPTFRSLYGNFSIENDRNNENMVRVIKQETYDEVVRENIEDFLMSPEEAIEDAIKQFKAQGIDLTNIIKDLVLDEKTDITISCLESIRSAVDSKSFVGIDEVLDRLKAELDKDIARRVHAGKEGAYKTLVELLEECKDEKTITKCTLRTITSLMTGYPDLLDQSGIDLQMEILDRDCDANTRQLVLRWIKECCLKHEMNRQAIFNAGILEKLTRILTRDDVTGPELRDALSAMRSLVLDDDVRHEFGKAHEHATHIARDTLETLTELLSTFKDDKAVVGDLMHTLASLIVRNEFCQTVHDAGGLQFIVDVMIDNPDSEKLNWQSLKLLKALAGNDNVKSHIVTSGSAPLIVSAISRFKGSEMIVSAGFACISALTLKSPSNAGIFYDCGAPYVIVDAMKHYSKSKNVLKQASWAVRNMSVRNKMESRQFVNHGIESVLVDALKAHGPELEPDLKAALRDLGLKVNLKEQWAGKGVSMRNE